MHAECALVDFKLGDSYIMHAECAFVDFNLDKSFPE